MTTMTTEPRRMNLEPATLTALGLDAEAAHAGNVAAHAYRLAFATGADLFAGINLGWRDQQASTDFLAGIVAAVDEMVTNDELDSFEDMSHELADSAVPTYNAERIAAAAELSAEVSDPGLLDTSGAITMAEFASVALYELAEQVATALVEAIRGEQNDDDEAS